MSLRKEIEVALKESRLAPANKAAAIEGRVKEWISQRLADALLKRRFTEQGIQLIFDEMMVEHHEKS